MHLYVSVKRYMNKLSYQPLTTDKCGTNTKYYRLLPLLKEADEDFKKFKIILNGTLSAHNINTNERKREFHVAHIFSFRSCCSHMYISKINCST